MSARNRRARDTLDDMAGPKKTAKRPKGSGKPKVEARDIAERRRLRDAAFESQLTAAQRAALDKLREPDDGTLTEEQNTERVVERARVFVADFGDDHIFAHTSRLHGFLAEKFRYEGGDRWADLLRISEALWSLSLADDAIGRAALRKAATTYLRSVDEGNGLFNTIIPIRRPELIRLLMATATREGADPEKQARALSLEMRAHGRLMVLYSHQPTKDADDIEFLTAKVAIEIKKAKRRVHNDYWTAENAVIAALVAWGLPKNTAKNWVYAPNG
jgi:hypothetical protein